MLSAKINFTRANILLQIRSISKNGVRMAADISPSADKNQNNNAEPSKRMKEFHEKLQLNPVPRVTPGMRFIDLMLVETNPSTGEMISNAEKDPTKWGDWQNGGRVSDF